MSIEPESAAWFRQDSAWRDRVAIQSAEYERMQGEQRASRAAKRSEATPVPLTLEALVDVIAERVAPDRSLGPKRRREYAEHLVQSYCECAMIEFEGWVLCAHAIDEGF